MQADKGSTTNIYKLGPRNEEDPTTVFLQDVKSWVKPSQLITKLIQTCTITHMDLQVPARTETFMGG